MYCWNTVRVSILFCLNTMMLDVLSDQGRQCLICKCKSSGCSTGSNPGKAVPWWKDVGRPGGESPDAPWKPRKILVQFPDVSIACSHSPCDSVL